jgi:solute carrier family 25 aspartate/glutamate transporter 12/13
MAEAIKEAAETVKETVVEAAVGTTIESQFPKNTQDAFMKNAIKDDESGEFFLDQERFIDTILPTDADFVSSIEHCWLLV